MTRGHTQIDCFFIDEGFGALDPDSLDDALEILLELQCRGKQVGIVSHVHELFERIDSHLQLEKNGVGESRLIEH